MMNNLVQRTIKAWRSTVELAAIDLGDLAAIDHRDHQRAGEVLVTALTQDP